MVLFSDRKPEEVFTPRSADVNVDMYVSRRDLEQSLADRLRSKTHLIVSGESGCGKSWLYKRYFDKSDIHYVIANLANASRYGSIAKEFAQIVADKKGPQKKGYEETKSAGVSAGFAKGDLSHKDSYVVPEADAFAALLQLIRDDAGKHPAFLVLDNLERIFDQPKLMSELADVVTLLDDARYSKYDVRLLVVGVPSGIREYFSKTKSQTTVANRLMEIREVSRLTKEEADALVLKGFENLLRYRIDDQEKQEILEHILWVTDRIPQALHEYCLELAFLAEKNAKRLSRLMLVIADQKWLNTSLSSAYNSVDRLLNERETRIGRRNQVLYCIGKTERSDFKASEIDALVRKHFPESTKDKALNIAQVLSELAGPEDGILKRAPKGDAFMFKDPAYRMCIRAMLEKVDGLVRKVEIVDVKGVRT